MTEIRCVHDYCLLFRQPKINDGILMRECIHCGDVVEIDAQEFFNKAYKKRAAHLFDFNSKGPQ